MKTTIMSVFRAMIMVAALSCGFGVLASATNVWTGATSGAWTEPANWDTYTVPAADDVAVFTGAATVTPPADFHGCIRNMGAGELAVAVPVDAEFHLALGTYSFADTGASFRKTGTGKLTLHAWPGINPGTVTVAEGAVAFAGNGNEAPGAFDSIVVEAGASATVVESPSSTRHGYAYRIGKPNMTWVNNGNSGDYAEFRTGDAAVLVRRWEQWSFVHEEYEGNTCRFSGIVTVDDNENAFDEHGIPTAAMNSVYALGNNNSLCYYRGIFLCDSDTEQTLTFNLTKCNSSYWNFAINDSTSCAGNHASPFSKQYSCSYSRGWATHTMGFQADLRFGGTPLRFNISDGTGALTGKRLWNGVCANSLEVAPGASFTIGDGQAFAISNARALKNSGTFASATDDAILYLASDWDTGDAVLKESSILGFTGTLEYGQGAMYRTLAPLADDATYDFSRHFPSLDEKASLQPLSDATWQRTGNTAYTNNNTAIAILDWSRKSESNGARAAIIGKEGIPTYCAFEMSCDFYMAENLPYKQQDADFGLFVQSEGPSLTYRNGYTSRTAYMLPKDKQAFGATLFYYYRKLCWVTNAVANASNVDNNPSAVVDLNSSEDSSWTRPASGAMKWSLTYDGYGTFTVGVQTNANGGMVTTTHTYPQLTGAKYADTKFYPSVLGRVKTDGYAIKPVIVSNIVLKVHSRTASAWPVAVEPNATVAMRGGTIDAADIPTYEMDGAELGAGSSVSVEPYGSSTGIKWTKLTVAGHSSIAAAQGATNTISSLVYTGSMQASTLTLTGTINFASPLMITIPAAWRSLGGSAVLVDYSAASCVAEPDLSQISIMTDEGVNVTSKFKVTVADGRLMIFKDGLCIIFR